MGLYRTVLIECRFSLESIVLAIQWIFIKHERKWINFSSTIVTYVFSSYGIKKTQKEMKYI